jgi:hypothetical protein
MPDERAPELRRVDEGRSKEPVMGGAEALGEDPRDVGGIATAVEPLRAAGELDDLDARSTTRRDPLGDGRERGPPRDADDVAGANQSIDQGRTEGCGSLERIGCVGRSDVGELDPERLFELSRQDVILGDRVPELDPNETGLERLLDQPGNAEPRDSESLGDLDLAQLALEEQA